MRQPLTNSGWGFASNCFVCEPSNPSGLRLPFFHDEDAAEVTADFKLDDRFSGAPTYVHGGIVLALLDEAMAWAAIAIAGQWAVTKETSAKFHRPVRVGLPNRLRAWIESASADEITAGAEIFDGKERLCTTARAVFSPLGMAQAVEATGGAVSAEDLSFVRQVDPEPKPS